MTNIGTASGCTLDLNGFRITTSQVIIYENHVLTIIDSSEKKTGSMVALWVDGGHVTIRDGINAGGNTRSGLDAAFAAAPNGSTVTVLGGDSITAYLDGGKSLTLALNGKDVSNIYVGRSEGANSLTVTGTRNIQNIYVHQDNEADLTDWTGKMEQLYVYSGGKATLDGTAQYAFYLTLQNVIDDQNRSDNNKNPVTLLQNISGDCAISSDVFIDMGSYSINGTLTIADGADWGSILPTEFDRHGYKLPKGDGGYEWRDSDTADAAVSSMTNVSIARLPIPSMTLLLWANGKATRSEPIGTTVRLEATCTTGASVTFYIQKEGSDTPVTLEGKDLNFGKYSAEYQFSEVGKYTVWFVGTKDGYSARSIDEPLTITKLEIPADAITHRQPRPVWSMTVRHRN